MGQAEIYEILKNNPGKKFTSDALAKEMGVSKSSTNHSLIRFRKARLPDVRVYIDENEKYKKHYYWFDATARVIE